MEELVSADVTMDDMSSANDTQGAQLAISSECRDQEITRDHGQASFALRTPAVLSASMFYSGATPGKVLRR